MFFDTVLCSAHCLRYLVCIHLVQPWGVVGWFLGSEIWDSISSWGKPQIWYNCNGLISMCINSSLSTLSPWITSKAYYPGTLFCSTVFTLGQVVQAWEEKYTCTLIVSLDCNLLTPLEFTNTSSSWKEMVGIEMCVWFDFWVWGECVV